MDYRITGLLLLGSLPATAATIALMHFSGVTKGWAASLTMALGVALPLTAVAVAYRQVWTSVGLRLERWLLSAPTSPTPCP